MVLVKFLLRQVVTCNTQEFKKRKESDRGERVNNLKEYMLGTIPMLFSLIHWLRVTKIVLC